MKRGVRFLALSGALAFAATLEGAPSGYELAGGPARRRGTAVLGAPAGGPSIVTLSVERPIRALEPGELLVLGPTAGPVSTPPLAAIAPAFATARAATDTVTVSAPAPPPTTGVARTWETYRTGNVLRVPLP